MVVGVVTLSLCHSVDLVFGYQPTAQNPLADVRQFILEFESEYGGVHPPFAVSTYEQVRAQRRQCADDAMELEYLLYSVHS